MAKEERNTGAVAEQSTMARTGRYQICGLFCRRNILAHARRPCFLFGVGALFLLISVVSLHFRTGGSAEAQWIGRAVEKGRLWFEARDPTRKATMTSATQLVRNGDGLTKKLYEQRFKPQSQQNRTADPKALVDRLAINVSAADVERMEQHLRQMQQMIKLGSFQVKPVTNLNTHRDVHFQYRELARIQAQRQERVRLVCQAKKQQADTNFTALAREVPYHEGWYGRKFLYAVMEVYRSQNFFFCPVLKVGSTFFRRLFYALSTGRTISSPYDIPISTALAHARENLKDVGLGPVIARASPVKRRHLLSLDDLNLRSPPDQHLTMGLQADRFIRDFMDKAGKVMFTREPYAKLLSGYVDKLFAPNPYFWSTVGRFAIRKFRPNASSKSLQCGHDVTFTEYIKYVIENERSNRLQRDTHFVPSYDQCKPCDVQYDVIGKMETFSADASLVVAQLGHNLSQSTLDIWSRESEYDAIADSIDSPYKWRREVTKCMTWEEANKRIWRKLQIRGILNRNQPLPMLNFQQYSRKSAYFIQVAKSHWEKFREIGIKSKQKKDALSSAYSAISREDLELLREYFLLDFDLFEYDSRPSKIFQAQRTWDLFDFNS